ncbi:unnamed protein product [Trifolium pratense]|uniref:Uncharacterized protein n=1 Tax=Trifolium pratense TaxID=57577 RepID=A0ACB0KDD4_TRIPR|nr:unnamed protein product [Trifolium pratense]
MVRPAGSDEEPVMEDVWAMKKQLPDFMGTDPVGWIAAAEWFFEKNEVPSRDKLQWAFMSMEDEQAMMWFYYWCEENPDADWKTFSMAMMRQFGAQVEYLTEKHVEPKLKVIEAFTNDREEVCIKEIDRESETIVIAKAERLETSETQRSEKERKMNDSESSLTLEDRTLLKEKPSKEPTTTSQSNIMLPPSKPLAAILPASTLLRRAPLPPEPPDVGARVRTVLPSSPLLKPPDVGRSATTLPRWVPPPKPPDTCPAQSPTANIGAVGSDSMPIESREVHGDQIQFIADEGWKGLEDIGVKWAFDDKVRLKCKIDELVMGHAYTMQCKLGQCCNLMGQTQEDFCCLMEVVIWAVIDLLGFNSNWAIWKGDGNLKLRGKDYISALHYGKKVCSSREQLSKTNAEETSLLFKFMPKVRNLDHFSIPQLAADKQYYNFVINHTNGPCELSTNSLMIQMDDHDALEICGEGVERSSNTEILLRGENVLMFINKESREQIMKNRFFFQASLASKNGRMEIMKFDLDWHVVIMLSFVIGLACDAKNVEMEADPTINALLSLHSRIQDLAVKVLTLLVFDFGNCYLIVQGECSFIPTSMESIEVLYVTATSLRDGLEASFSYSPKLANEIMLSCRKGIATLNNQNRKREVTTLMSTLQFENFTMNGIVNDGVGMFLGITEETIFDILEVGNEFVLISIFNVFDIWSDVLVTALLEMHMKQGHVSCARGVVTMGSGGIQCVDVSGCL